MQQTLPTDERPPFRRFGRFELQPQERRLLADGQPVAVGARAFDLLAVLVERAGQLMTKTALLERVWPGLVVEENNLQVQVSALRKVLGPNAVATIPGRGYRFELPVERAEPPAPAAAPAVTPPPPALVRARTNLPHYLMALYGRAQDLAAIKGLLREHAVVTIVGAGGIGKTRVAQAAAAEVAVESSRDYHNGVWWVELAALTDAALAPSAVARAMNVQLPADRPPVETLASILASQQMLIVLDNCEHLIDAVAEIVESVRAAAPRVRFLVTSQETLKTADAHIYRLGALAVPAADSPVNALQAGAVELFAARAQAVDPNFALTAANTAAVIEICRRLDGIPLAIELAAARLPLLGVEGLRARLGERFNVLTAGARVVLRRHQTLRATLEWSHGLLTPDEQTVFRRLGVFAGSFTLEAAQDVAGDEHIEPWAALDQLGALIDKSLVLAEGDPVPRYRLLETTRAYALERLAEAGETERMLRRHAEAMLALLAVYERDDRRWRNTASDMLTVAAELDNVRAALAWAAKGGAVDLVLPLAGASFHVWWAATHLAEGLERTLALREHARDGAPERDVARYWLAVAMLGQYSMRRESYDAALRAAELFRRLGNDPRRYDALLTAAVQGMRFGTTAQMQQAIDEAAPLERPDWPPRQRAALAFARCWWYARLGRAEEALVCAQRQAAINREGGSFVGEQYAISNVMAMELLLDRPEAALEHGRAAIARLVELRAEDGAGHLYHHAAVALILLDRLDEAMAAERKAYALLRQEGDEHRSLMPLALIAAMRGRLADAARIIGLDAAIHARTGETVRPVADLLRARLDKLLAAGMSASERARLEAEGADVRDAQGFRLAFGDDA